MDQAAVFFYDVLKATFALLVVVDPIGLVPVYAGLTKDMQTGDRRQTLKTAIYTGSALLVVFALVGQQLFALFGISLYSFMIAGGILLLLLSIEALIRDKWAAEIASAQDVGVVPVAFPLIVGPGAITATIVMLQSSGLAVALSSISIVMLVTWIVLRLVHRIHSLLGKTGSAVITRMMAVFTAAIAIQFILTGIQFYYPPR